MVCDGYYAENSINILKFFFHFIFQPSTSSIAYIQFCQSLCKFFYFVTFFSIVTSSFKLNFRSSWFAIMSWTYPFKLLHYFSQNRKKGVRKWSAEKSCGTATDWSRLWSDGNGNEVHAFYTRFSACADCQIGMTYETKLCNWEKEKEDKLWYVNECVCAYEHLDNDETFCKLSLIDRSLSNRHTRN